MADEFLSEKEARDWLRAAIERHKGAVQLAKKVGVSRQLISMMLSGKSAITGKVAAYLGLKRVNGYELTKVIPSPEQERYENVRARWREQNEAFFTGYLAALARAAADKASASTSSDQKTDT